MCECRDLEEDDSESDEDESDSADDDDDSEDDEVDPEVSLDDDLFLDDDDLSLDGLSLDDLPLDGLSLDDLSLDLDFDLDDFDLKAASSGAGDDARDDDGEVVAWTPRTTPQARPAAGCRPWGPVCLRACASRDQQ